MAPNNERLFVDLIFRSSRKYPNWDPEVVVNVGDYGRITAGKKGLAFWRKAQGTFIKDGNIYDDKIAEKYDIPLPKEHGVDATEGRTWITSRNAQEVNFDGSIAGQTPALAQCELKATFKFTSGRGAILAMDNDTVTTINPPGKLRRLLDEKSMKDSVIVSEVHQCSSYARFLASEEGATVALGLSVEPPVANVGAASVDAKWVHSSSAGNFKSKVDKSGKRAFYPLFRLVSLKESSVSSGLRGELDMDPPLPDADPPWTPMEEEEEQSGTGVPVVNETAREDKQVTRTVFRLPLFGRRK